MELGLGLQLGRGLSGIALAGGGHEPASGGGSLNVALTNPDFEAGSLTGWSTISGVGYFTIADAATSATSDPHGGTYYARAESDATCRMGQIVDIEAAGVPVAKIDAGLAEVEFSGFLLGEDGVNDGGQLSFHMLDGAGALISAVGPGTPTTPPASTWTAYSFTGAIPAGTRQIQFRVTVNQNSGGPTRGCWDDLAAVITWT